MIVNDVGDDNVFLEGNKKRKNIENNKEMCPHTCWGPQGSINIRSESQTLRIYACVCICEACERRLLMELGVIKVIEVDLIIVLIFYSFKMFLLVLDFIKCSYVNGCLEIITKGHTTTRKK